MPTPGLTVTARVKAAEPRSRDPVADLAPDLGRLALVVLVDALFLVGVLLPYLTFDGEVAEHWLPDILGVPMLLTLIFLPWVTLGSASLSGYRLWRDSSGPVLRGIRLCVVILALAGAVTYFSPWGFYATRWLMD